MEGPVRFATWLGLAGAAAALAAPASAAASAWRFHGQALGTSLDIVAVTPARETALIAAQAARAEIARLDAVLSGWRADSELSRLNAADRLAVSEDLYRVIADSERWRTLTGAAFDARRGALYRGAAHGATQEATQEAGAEPKLDPAARAIVRPRAVSFAPEALAKGYVVDAGLAAALEAAPGLDGLMLDIGGDLRAWGRGPGGADWTAGVAEPGGADNARAAALVRLADRALATSGAGGLSRLFDRDGRAARDVVQASVVARSAADADALATTLCVMAPNDGLALAERLPGMEARLVEASGAVRATSGWDRLSLSPVPAPSLAGPAPRLVRIADEAARPWPAGFQVRIDYVLPNKGARAYAPYVAIWVTDEAGQLVRAVTMLGRKLDYVGENYVWWRRYGRVRPQLVAAISRPTRPAGRYSVVWDGKDDMGRPAPQGRYTIHVEATREDGLHSYQSIELALGAAPARGTGEPGEELGPTLVRYGRP
jgi:thiamine biosynthesis lipoprotein